MCEGVARSGDAALVDARRAGHEQLDRVRRDLDELDLEFEVRQIAEGGDAAEVLLEVSEQEQASVIVIGLRHRTPVGKLILTLEGPGRRELTPPGGARDLLPAEYAYTLTAEVLGALPPGRYRFVARVRGSAGGAAVVRQAPGRPPARCNGTFRP